jgi:predicted lipid-binding transport protein (Tim44 family)
MRRRILQAAALATAAVLTLAPAASALGGGGSAHFGGGGFGGGGGGGGLGHGLSGLGHGFSGLGRGIGHFHVFFLPIGGGGGLFLLILLAIIVFVVLPRLFMMFTRARQRARSTGPAARRKVQQRERRVELAAAEAADDDPAFAPDQVKPAASDLFLAVQKAWDARDRIRLRGLVAPELLDEWERRLDDFDRKGWRNRVEVESTPHVDYVGLQHEGEKNDRVTVRIEATVRDYVVDRFGQHHHRDDALTDQVKVREYWTLVRRDDHWILGSIEQGGEGAHALSDEIVASPWSNDRRMRDESLIEGAVADAVPEGTNVADLADLDFSGDARAAANDLSLADGRFAPDVLEVAARRVVQGWVDAVDGSDEPLERVADRDAVASLLHPDGPNSRQVVRGLQIERIRIATLDAAATPPSMTLELELAGRRYLEDRDTAGVLAGDQSRVVRFTEHWTLTLSGDASEPWKLASTAASVAPR